MQTTPMQMRVAFQTANPCHCLWIDEGHYASCHPLMSVLNSLVCHFHFRTHSNDSNRMSSFSLPLSTPLSGQTFILLTKASL